MDNLKPLTEKIVGYDKFKELNLSENPPKIFSMFTGTVKGVTLLCKNDMANVIIDTFGREIRMNSADKEHFRVRVNVEVSSQFFGWLCGLKPKDIVIESPDDVIEEMRKHVEKITETYKKQEKT